MQSQTLLLILGAAILAMGIAVFQYFYKVKYKTDRNRIYAVLRFLSVFCLLLLLINPKFKQVTYSVKKPALAIAIDNSSSIVQLGFEQEAKDAVSRLGESENLNDAFEIEFYTFDQEFKRLDTLDFEGPQTNITQSLRELNTIYDGETAPVVLLTDGNQTYGEPYQYLLNYPQQVYPVVLGDTLNYDDLKIGQVNVNRYAYINNEFPVEIFTSYKGEGAVSSTLSIRSGNTTVFSRKINFTSEKSSQIINALLPAKRVGVQQYTISLQPVSEERNTDNNYKNFAIEVIDQKTNVLLISNVVHPDLGMFKKSIESNKLRTVTFANALESLEKLNDYELVILYQPDQRFKDVYERLQQLTKNSITVAGPQTSWSTVNNFQNTIRQEITGQSEEVQGVLNPNFSAFLIEDIGFNNLPPLKTTFGETQFLTDVDVALTQSIGAFDTQNPLIATTEDAGRREVYILGEGLWRWRAQSFIDRNTFEDFDKFIDNLIQYAASNKKKNRLNIDYKSFYYGNGNAILYAQYFDKNYNFDERAKLSISIFNKETKQTIEIPLLLTNNTYKVALDNLTAGDYSFTVKVADQGLSGSGSFTIVPFEIEKQFINADVTHLRTLASNTGGAVADPASIDQLINDLINDKRYKPVQKSTENSLPLVDWRWLLAILSLLLALEWFMRKYNGLT